MTPQDNGDVLRFIAATVESLRDRMTTKDDLAQLRQEMKGDLEDLRTDIKGDVAELREETKANLTQLRQETKADLAQLRQETKSGLARLEAQMDVGFTAVRGDLERVNLRLDSIEGALSTRLSQLETEVSRLRSVVYLLAKDRPELLRLLGSGPPVM